MSRNRALNFSPTAGGEEIHGSFFGFPDVTCEEAGLASTKRLNEEMESSIMQRQAPTKGCGMRQVQPQYVSMSYGLTVTQKWSDREGPTRVGRGSTRTLPRARRVTQS